MGDEIIDLKLTHLSRNLRKRETDAERLLWQHIRSKQIDGFKFRRQQCIGRYIVDFVCFERKAVIEVDGGQHSEERADKARDRWLNKEGFQVLRFWNNEVLLNLKGVLEVIRKFLNHPPLTPPIKGGGK
ncbi:hypothetical protein BMS3Bbin06_01647 [bacterium BMS3Bbin06]|nr:hypothetical protein BMS3Bbin06_01647 [bacterium BMS3Bbin06]